MKKAEIQETIKKFKEQELEFAVRTAVEARDKEIEEFVHGRMFKDEGSELRKLVNEELGKIEQFLHSNQKAKNEPITVDLPPCNVCEEPCELTCERCGEHYCEKHKATYNQFTQIDYDCCSMCQESMKEQN